MWNGSKHSVKWVKAQCGMDQSTGPRAFLLPRGPLTRGGGNNKPASHKARLLWYNMWRFVGEGRAIQAFGKRTSPMANDVIPVQKNEIVVYQPNETLRLEVKLEDETVWLTQSQMGELFGCTTRNVRLHLENIYASGELDEASTGKDFFLVRQEGNRRVSRHVTLRHSTRNTGDCPCACRRTSTTGS